MRRGYRRAQKSRLPPGFGLTIQGALVDLLLVGVTRDMEIEDPVYVIALPEGELFASAVVSRTDSDTVDELLSPIARGGNGAPTGPTLLR